MNIQPILDQQKHMESFYHLLNYCFKIDETRMKETVEETFMKNDTEVIGAIENDELMAATVINDYEMYWNGMPVKMGGIGAVSTYPEYREKQCIKHILVECLKRMHDKGQIFSLLAPFSYAFYEKYGWAYAENFQTIKIDINDINAYKGSGFYCKKVDQSYINDLKPLFAKCYDGFNGAVKRRALEWNHNFTWQKHNKAYAYGVFDENNNLRGYFAYTLVDGLMKMDDWVYDDYDVKRYILQFALVHRAQVGHLEIKVPMGDTILHLLKNPRQEIKVHTGMMARVVSAERVLLDYAYNTKNLAFSLQIEDEYAPWNNGKFAVVIENGISNVSKIQSELAPVDLIVSIQVFSQIAFGFIDWQEAYKQKNVSCNDEKLIDQLTECMPKKPTYVTSYF